MTPNYKHYREQGILFINDLINSEGERLAYEDVKTMYNIYKVPLSCIFFIDELHKGTLTSIKRNGDCIPPVVIPQYNGSSTEE